MSLHFYVDVMQRVDKAQEIRSSTTTLPTGGACSWKLPKMLSLHNAHCGIVLGDMPFRMHGH